MIYVRFYSFEEIREEHLAFAVIASRYQEKWVYCKHRRRDTMEIPGGHREPGEAIQETARRELYEETGAIQYRLEPVCIYSVQKGAGEETFGALFLAEIEAFGPLPPSEMERIALCSNPPARQTYPEIQPFLLEKAAEYRRARLESAGPCLLPSER